MLQIQHVLRIREDPSDREFDLNEMLDLQNILSELVISNQLDKYDRILHIIGDFAVNSTWMSINDSYIWGSLIMKWIRIIGA